MPQEELPPQHKSVLNPCDSPTNVSDTTTPCEQPEITPELADVLRNLNSEHKAVIIQSVKTAIKRESFSGPIPHPEILRGYESIKAGFAERIVSMAEREQEHRFKCDNHQFECNQKIIENVASDSRRGQYFALIISILFLGASMTLAILGHETVAAIFGGGTLSAIVAAFIIGRKDNSPKDIDPDTKE